MKKILAAFCCALTLCALGLAQAQKHTVRQPGKQYGLCVRNDTSGNMQINIDETIVLDASGLAEALYTIPRLGWTLHSVVQGGTGAGYVVIVEK